MDKKTPARSLPTLGIALAACGLTALSVHAAAPPPYYPLAIGLEAGTTGPGASASWRFMDHFGVRGGFNYLPYDRNGKVGDVDYKGSLRLLSEPLTLDLYPSKTSSFHVSAGLALNQNRLTGTANGAMVSGVVVPDLNLSIKQRFANPYLSIGGNFFHFDKAHHWAFGGELGAMYTGKPQISLTTSSMTPAVLAAVQKERDKADHYAKQVQFWPVLKLGVNYSF